MDYRANFGTALELMQASAQLMGLFLPGHEMQEAQNKLEAFRLFAYVDQELGFDPNRPEPFPLMVRRALTRSMFQRVFALEGVGHYFTSAAPGPLSGLLADPALPACAMVSLHAGMGTSLAGKALAQLDANPSKASLRHAVETFFERCRANAREGWYENAIEPLGLSVRTMRPELLARISDVIGEIDTTAQRLFWHGVGRSLYFVPMHFLTVGGSHQRALAAAIAEAPTLEDRDNAVAGLVWAVTLVNIRHPAVLKNLLPACEKINMPSAVGNGIASALIIWKDIVPEDGEVIAPYLRPLPPTAPQATLWSDLVASPASRVLGVPRRVASVFQYQPVLTS